MVNIRPEETVKKVLVKVGSTYGFQKELGENFRISLETNRKGGVLVPFKHYAESFMDPDLEFYDSETGERLGIYNPPADNQTTSIEDLLKSIKEMVVSNREEKSKLVDSLREIVKEEHSPRVLDLEVTQLLELPWQERKNVIENIDDLGILQQIADALKSKSSLGKTNREILRYIKDKLGE